MMEQRKSRREQSVVFKKHRYGRKVYLGEVRVIKRGEPPKNLVAFV